LIAGIVGMARGVPSGFVVLFFGVMCAVGLAPSFFRFPDPQVVPLVIAAVEIIFGAWLIRMSLANDSPPEPGFSSGIVGG
jgi:hypothetical protein